MDMKKLGLRIKSQREKRKLRQADIANALQISAQAVSKWERGENAPDISVLLELSRLLGVSIEWLLGGTMAEKDTFIATVFCTDLKGFAKKATEMSPRDLAVWSNTIHYTVTEALKQFDGIPIKYMGDGLLGFFSGTKHPERAWEAAKKARKLMGSPDLNIALHRGEIFLGNIGHPDYESTDIIGRTVNTTFLIMPWVAKNCKTGTGITESVFNNLENNSGLRETGEIKVIGEEKAIKIYEPTPD